MRSLADAPETLESVRAILANPNHPHFAAVHRTVCDRGHGRVAYTLDVHGDAILADVLHRGRERVARLRGPEPDR
jgi:hypothetical protein